MKRLRTFLLLALILCVAAAVGCSSGSDKQYLEEGFTSTVVFELGGGVLTTNSTDVNGSIKYAYKPDSYIVDPGTIAGYTLWRDGYTFKGWFRDEACTDDWDFKTDKLGDGTVTLYAKWTVNIRYTYTLCYSDENGDPVELYAYNVAPGEAFADRNNKADTRTGYTKTGFYRDAALTEPWPAEYVHPGGETDTDVRVYVAYIEGVWDLVDSYDKLRAALSNGRNVYLTDNVDCAGNEIPFTRYGGVFEGNGYAVSGMTRTASAGTLYGKLSLFGELTGTAEIRNVAFTDVRLTTAKATYRELNVSALANKAADGCKIKQVTVTGTLTIADDTSFGEGAEADLTRLNEAFYQPTGAVIADFSSEITVNNP